MINFLFSIFLFIFLIFSIGGFSTEKVYDGDTILLMARNGSAIKVRLADIDAPEIDEPFGYAAKDYLTEIIKNCQFISIQSKDIDKYGRTIATVTACGHNVNQEMVKMGLAWVYKRYNTDPLLPALEAEAKASRRGLLADPAPVYPEIWRHSKKTVITLFP